MDSEARAEKGRFREYSPELGLLLWAVWNPVGADVPLDEYDGYVPMIWTVLAKRPEVDEVAERLNEIADERMGGPRGTEQAAAEVLSQWWYWRFDFPAEFEARS